MTRAADLKAAVGGPTKRHVPQPQPARAKPVSVASPPAPWDLRERCQQCGVKPFQVGHRCAADAYCGLGHRKVSVVTAIDDRGVFRVVTCERCDLAENGTAR